MNTDSRQGDAWYRLGKNSFSRRPHSAPMFFGKESETVREIADAIEWNFEASLRGEIAF